MSPIFAKTDVVPLIESMKALFDDIINGRGDYTLEIWGMPLSMLAVGLAAGVGLAVWLAMDRSSAKQVSSDGHVTDLQQQRDTVIEALHALELEREKIPEQDYLRERQALLTHGAQAMRELEEPMSNHREELTAALEASAADLGPERTKAIQALLDGAPLPKAAKAKPAIPPMWMGGLVTLVGIAVLGFIGLAVSTQAPPSKADAEVRQAPQRPQRSAQPPAPREPIAPTPEEIAWAKTVETEPGNMEALDGLTNGAILREDWPAARKYNAMALKVDPKSPDARTFEALLTYQGGGYPQSIAMLDSVIADAPEYSRARELRGIVHMQMGEFDQAVEQLQAAANFNDDPARKSRLEMMVGQAKTAATQAGAANTPDLGGTITVEGVEIPDGATLFVSVSPPGSRMPLRAKKIATTEFPVTFSLTAKDAPMRGGPLPELVNVTLKVDLDGNPMGDDAGAPPKVVLENVKAGTLDLELVLKP